jgi:hypothetical protein
VGVSVERQRDGGVAEPFLDDLGVFAGSHQQRGVAVPQIIEPDSRQLGPLEQRLKVPVDDVLRVEQPAELVGEDQPLVWSEPLKLDRWRCRIDLRG